MSETDELLATAPVAVVDDLFGVDVETALRTVSTRRGRGVAEIVVSRQLENGRVAMERVHRYADACVRAGLPADPTAVLRLLHSCDAPLTASAAAGSGA